MAIDRSLLDRIRSRGEQVLTELSAELMSNPRFVKALRGAMRGREKLEQAASNALRQVDIPTPGEVRRTNTRIAALEQEVAALRARLGATRARAKPAAPRRAAASAAGRPVARGPAPRKTGSRAPGRVRRSAAGGRAGKPRPGRTD